MQCQDYRGQSENSCSTIFKTLKAKLKPLKISANSSSLKPNPWGLPAMVHFKEKNRTKKNDHWTCRHKNTRIWGGLWAHHDINQRTNKQRIAIAEMKDVYDIWTTDGEVSQCGVYKYMTLYKLKPPLKRHLVHWEQYFVYCWFEQGCPLVFPNEGNESIHYRTLMRLNLHG